MADTHSMTPILSSSDILKHSAEKVVQHNTDTAMQLNKYNQLIKIHENFDIAYSTYL